MTNRRSQSIQAAFLISTLFYHSTLFAPHVSPGVFPVLAYADLLNTKGRRITALLSSDFARSTPLCLYISIYGPRNHESGP
jgi:hypothetical protein